MTRQEVDQVDGRLVQVICRKVWLSQAKYIECVLDCFNMKNAKSICTPLASRTKLSKKMRLKTKEEKDSMGEVPYSFTIGSLITQQFATHDIAHASGAVNRFLGNPRTEHWDLSTGYSMYRRNI